MSNSQADGHSGHGHTEATRLGRALRPILAAATLALMAADVASAQVARPSFLTETQTLGYNLEFPELEIYAFYYTRSCDDSPECDCDILNEDLNGDGLAEPDVEDSCIATGNSDDDPSLDIVQDDNSNGIPDLVDPDWRGGGPFTGLVPSVVYALSQALPVYREDWGFEAPHWGGSWSEIWLYDFPEPEDLPEAAGLAHSDGSRVELDPQALRAAADNLPRSVMAHEAWHMTQYAHAWSKQSSGDWGVEGQARMIEDRVLPALDIDPQSSFLASARAYLANPTWVEDGRAVGLLNASYDAALWWSYLIEQAGSDFVGTSGEGMDFVKAVFDLRQQLETGGKTAIDQTLRVRTSRGFDDTFWDFTIANYAKDVDVHRLDPRTLEGRSPQAVLRHRDELEVADGVVNFGAVAREAFDAAALATGAVGGVVDAARPGVNDADAMPAYGAKYFEAELPDAVACPLVTWQVLNFDGEPLMHSFLVLADDSDGNGREELVALERHRGDVFSRGLLNKPEYRRIAGIVATGEGSGASFTWEARCSANLTVDIIEPTTDFPAAVGDPTEPGRFLVWLKVQDLPTTDSVTGLEWERDFNVTVSGQPATILNGDYVQNQYWLLVQAPDLPANLAGQRLPLLVSLTQTNASDTELSAVAYEVISKDQVMVLDNSGSMANQNKLVSAQAAARLFTDAIQAQDQIGVVSFSDTAALEFDLTEAPDQDDAAKVRADAKQAINGIVALNQTSIGAGLSLGQSILNKGGAAGSEAWMVLLSDGIENRPPLAMDVIGSAVEPAGTKVHAIALGSDADPALMRDVAVATCGEIMVDHCFHALDNDGLPLPALAIAPPPLPDLTNELADIYRRAGETIANHQRLWQDEGSGNQVIKLTVTEKGAKEAFLSFNWRDATRPFNVSITPPSGAIPFTYLSDGANHATYFSLELVPGEYTIQISGNNEWIGSLSARVVEGAEMHAFIDTTEEDRKVLEPVQLQVSLSDDDGPVPGASVSAAVYRFDGTEEAIELRDDGVAPHDDEPRDGVYGYSYDRVNGVESHSIIFEITATGESFSRHQRLTYRPADTSRPDQDNDGLVDRWQQRYEVSGGNRDPDRDGLTNRQEMNRGTNPRQADTDRGGESDGSEVAHGRDPLAERDDAIPPVADFRCEARPEAATLRFDSRNEYSQVRVFRRTKQTPFTSIGDFDASDGAVEDSGLINKQEYLYFLQARGPGNVRGGYSAMRLCQPKEDPYPPASLLVINDSADTTDETDVILRMGQTYSADGTAEITQVKLSNSPDVYRRPWRSFAATMPWTIEPDPVTGWAYVYALFGDDAGNVSRGVAADGIVYDPN